MITLDRRNIGWIIFGTLTALCVTGILMAAYGFNRFSIRGYRTDNGRVEFEFYDNFVYLFSHNKQLVAPVTDIKLYSSANEDSTVITNKVVFYTTTNKFVLEESEVDLSSDEIGELYPMLDEYIINEEARTFSNSFFSMGFYGLLGLILAVGAGYFAFIFFKKIPKRTEAEQKMIEEKAKKVKAQKQKEKAAKAKKEVKLKEISSGERLLKILVFIYESEVKFNLTKYETPDTHSIGVVCTPAQKNNLMKEYSSDIEYFVCDPKKGSAQAMKLIDPWIQDFAGYLIVQTDDLQNITSRTITGLYKSHKGSGCESTILVTETQDEVITSGKIMRNIANRITGISENSEPNDNMNKIAHVFAGMFCFNSKKIIEMLNKLIAMTPSGNPSLTRLIEVYYKFKNKLNIYTSSEVLSHSSKKKTGNEDTHIVSTRKNISVILSTSVINNDKLRTAMNIFKPLSERIYTVIKEENLTIFKELSGDDSIPVFSKGNLGNADDVLATNDVLRDFNGNVIVVTEKAPILTQEIVKKLLSEHTDQNSICSYIKKDDEIVIYCTDSFQFLYAVKKVPRDPETKQYHLWNIIDILVEGKKKVHEVVL